MSLRLTTIIAVHIFNRTPQKLAKQIVNNVTMRSAHYLRHSMDASLHKSISNRYRKLKYPKDRIQATYVWIDGTGENIRFKDRILNKAPKCPEDLPEWHYDGSSTYQSIGTDSDVKLVPRTIYKDPFKVGKKDVIAMCETYYFNGKPTATNHRCMCNEAVEKAAEAETWFGIEQEYVLLDGDGKPFGWPDKGLPSPHGPYYCAAGGSKVYAREIVEAHALACLYAGINFTGTNSEVTPAQWEYQVGPSPGMKAADDLWISRYILFRIAEDFGLDVSLDPKPITNWNGSGAHTNFSTKAMREDGGIKAIEEAIEKLSKRHKYHITQYDPHSGKDNERRLVGSFEASSIDKFSVGVANRDASVRIPRNVATAGKGYLEDRRPSSNCDPYQVCNALIRTIVLDETDNEENVYICSKRDGKKIKSEMEDESVSLCDIKSENTRPNCGNKND